MLLSAVMKLDGGAFTTPLGKALEGIKMAVNLAGDLGEKLKGAFDMGGALSDLQARTGELPGTLKILQQAFEDTGVGGDSLGQTLAIMKKALGGINNEGQPTGKIFKQLGLDVESLKTQSATDQLKAISSAISGLGTPAEQTTAAMAIFGKSGDKMLTFLKDGGAIDAAAASLGGLPGLMNNNAAAFDAVSDRIGRIKNKSQGLWAGIAEGFLPLADSITQMLDGIDLTAVGQRIGAFFGTLVELFKSANLGQILKDSIEVALSEAVNWAVTGFIKLGGVLWKALSTPLSYWDAAVEKVIQELFASFAKISGYLIKAFATPISYITALFTKMFEEIKEQIAKVPGLRDKLGIEKGYKARSFSEIQQSQVESVANIGQKGMDFKAQSYDEIQKKIQKRYSDMGDAAMGIDKIEIFSAAGAKGRLQEEWDSAANRFRSNLANIQDTAQAGVKKGTGDLLPPGGATAPKAPAIASDQLARIGGFIGGNNQFKMESLAERTAKATEKMANLLANKGKANFTPVWGKA